MNISKNIVIIKEKIEEYAKLYQRDENSIHLLAVSKGQPVSAIQEAYLSGQRDFGENYLQEALEKIKALSQHQLHSYCHARVPISEPGIQKYKSKKLDSGSSLRSSGMTDDKKASNNKLNWHFIGPIQSNKTRDIAENFSWVHSVDRVKIAERLSEQRPASLPALNIFLQVNIDREATKSGFDPKELLTAARYIAGLPNLHVKGLMAIPAPCEDFTEQRAAFAKLVRLQDELIANSLDLTETSMGMSNDMQAAIAEGSNWLRIGTAIFGKR